MSLCLCGERFYGSRSTAQSSLPAFTTTILQTCGLWAEADSSNSTAGKTYSPILIRLPRWISNADCGPDEKNSCNCSRDACSRAASVSIISPVSWSCVCQACRNLFAVASARPYEGSGACGARLGTRANEAEQYKRTQTRRMLRFIQVCCSTMERTERSNRGTPLNHEHGGPIVWTLSNGDVSAATVFPRQSSRFPELILTHEGDNAHYAHQH